jgi:hypothetical protein
MSCVRNILLIATLVVELLSCSSQNDKDIALVDVNIGDNVQMEVEVLESLCIPDCHGGICGPNGCGGTCGSCPAESNCLVGSCYVPDCADIECGSDGAGGYCGNGESETEGCPAGLICTEGKCGEPCFPNCVEKQCGDDGCGGSCGTCPCDLCNPEAITCEDGICEVPPECDCQCLFDCYGTCEEGDQACFQDCVNKGPTMIGDPYGSLLTCLDQAGYFDCDEDDEECLQEAFDPCKHLIYPCLHGDTPCVDMYICLIGCPPGEDGTKCAQTCFNDGSLDALQTWDIFINCLDDAGYFECDDEDEICFTGTWSTCEAEFLACAHADQTCGEISVCLDECDADELCEKSCVAHGTIEAQGLWGAVDVCIAEMCGEESAPECKSDSLAGACAAAFEACTAG